MPRPNNPEWLKKYGEQGSNWHAQPQEMPAITHRMFAGGDTEFQKWCSEAGVSPNKCQARKFRAKRGKAYSAKKEAERIASLA